MGYDPETMPEVLDEGPEEQYYGIDFDYRSKYGEHGDVVSNDLTVVLFEILKRRGVNVLKIEGGNGNQSEFLSSRGTNIFIYEGKVLNTKGERIQGETLDEAITSILDRVKQCEVVFLKNFLIKMDGETGNIGFIVNWLTK